MPHLLEREQHLAALETLLAAVRVGAGGAVVVEGPAGIGKSSLLAAACATAIDNGMQVLQARGTELERDFPLGVARQALEPLLHPPDARNRLLAGPARLAEHALLGVPGGHEVEGAGILYGLYWLVVNAAADAPLVLVVDDAQWADEPSLRFVAYLARRAASLPFALLIGTRPPAGPDAILDALAADPDVRRILPAPLAVDGVRRMLVAAVGGPVGDAFAGSCWDATGGNPFLVSELVATLREQEVSFTDASVDQVAEVTPPMVARRTSATLARLGADATALAQAVAVLGDGVALDLAAQLADIPLASAPAAAAALVRVGLLVDEMELRFRHPLLVGAVRASLAGPERSLLHARAAALLEARGAPLDRVAAQLRRAPPAGDATVVARLREAAASARDRGAPATAAALLQRALAEPPPEQLRGELLVELARNEIAVGRSRDATDHLLAAEGCAADPRVRARALAMLPQANPGTAAFRDRLLALVQRTLPEVEPIDRELGLRLRAVQVLIAGAPAPVDVAGATLGEAVLLGHLVFGRMGPGASAAEIGGLGARALSHVDGLLADGESSIAFSGVALALRWADRLDEAEQCTSRAVEHARRLGSTGDYATALTLRSAVHRRAGRLREAEADARLAVGAAVGGEWSFPTGAVALISCLLDRGEVEEAGLLLGEAGLEGPILDAPPLLSALLVRMRLRAAQRDHVRGLEDWAEAVRRAERRRGIGASWIEDLAAVVELRRMAGDDHGARDAAAQTLTLARAWGTPGALGQALRLQARAGAEAEVESASLREAVALLAGSSLLLEHARALTDLGSALRRSGRRGDSRVPLREGLDLAHRCGADGLAEHAREELRATGVRVQRAALHGVDALTPSERRIADLAAEGRTNAGIAQELFLTVKTIEMHLTQAYRKLDVTGRPGLADALA